MCLCVLALHKYTHKVQTLPMLCNLLLLIINMYVGVN